MPERQEEARFVKDVDAGFDVLNARACSDPKPLRQGFPRMPVQHQVLKRLEWLMLNARFGAKKSLLPFQKGFLVTLASMKALANDMQDMFGDAVYLLTGRVTQDSLESFFSQVRGKGGPHTTPDSTEAKHRMRALTLQYLVRWGVNPKNITSAAESGVPSDDAEAINSTDQALEELLADDEEQEDQQAAHMIAETERVELSCSSTPSPVDAASGVSSEDYAMAHCAGYLASKMGDRNLGAPSSSVDRGESEPAKEALFTHLLSAGGLTLPTASWLAQYKAMDDTFRAFHSSAPDGLSRDPGVVTRLTDVLSRQFPDLDRRLIKRFAKLRTLKRMTDVNMKRRNVDLAEKREAKKLKKFVGARF